MGNSHLYKQWKSRLTFMLFVTPASLFLMLFWLVPIAAAIGIKFYGLGLYDLRIPDDRMGQLSGTFKG